MKKVPQIQKTDFEKQKDKLKEFSEQTSLNPEFETYKTNGGLFGWFDHTIHVCFTVIYEEGFSRDVSTIGH